LRGNGVLPNPALAPVREAIQGWEQLAGGFLATATSGAVTQSNVILSYAFTTEANTDILLSMAAPENYLFGLFANTAGLETAVGEDTVVAVATGVAAALNAANAANPDWEDLDPTTDAGLLETRNTDTYKTSLANSVAESLVGEAGVNDIIDAIEVGVIGGDADTPEKVAAVKASATYASTVQSQAANGAGALLKAASNRPQSRSYATMNLTGIGAAADFIPHSANPALLNNDAITYQGAITLPQFMADKATDRDGFWKSRDADGISQVGAVIDAAFGNEPLTTPPKDDDETGNVTYRFPFAQHVEDVQVPVLITMPTDGGTCGAKPANGWKTIIFQHGITTDRTASLPFASRAAEDCYATVAIDMPTHGLDAASTDRDGAPKRYSAFNTFNVAGYVAADTPYSAFLANDNTGFENLAERHGNLYLDAAQQPTAMDFTPDAENGDTGTGDSGSFFINLTNMQQTRDHLRQAVMDLLNLNASIANMDVDGGGAGDLDEDNLYFAGHSLGAIVGMTYVAVNNAVAGNASITDKDLKPIKAAVFANPGGQLPKLLENSPSFSEKILPGLAASGLTQGMLNLEKFYATFQAPLDSVDPVNFTGLLSATGTPVLIQEMVGSGEIEATDSVDGVTGLPSALITGGFYPADTVVPNNANPALNAVPTGLSYLAGTDPLIEQLELTQINATQSGGATPLKVVARFKEGTHGTFSSSDAMSVFNEMVDQATSLFDADGVEITIGDADQLEAPAAE